MVHPIIGKTISSYKKLMHDLATAETWQTAFEEDFRGMVQGDNKMGQIGTHAMFIMMHDEIRHILGIGKKLLMVILLLTTGRRKKTHIGYELQRAATL